MNRRTAFRLVAALSFSATVAGAQTVQFRVTAPNAPGGSTVSWDPPGTTPTLYVSPYTGVLTATNQTVILNCVDFFHHAALNTTYTANQSYLDGSLTNTRFNNLQAYLQAAWLTQQYSLPNPGATSDSRLRTIAIQAAIWNLLTPSAPDRVYGTNPSNNAYDHAWWITQSLAHWQEVNASNFYLLTPTNVASASSFQEFLVYDPSRPPTTVPEPATMVLLGTGLAGLAGAARRRNKEKQAVS